MQGGGGKAKINCAGRRRESKNELWSGASGTLFSNEESRALKPTLTPGELIGRELWGWEVRKTNQIAPPRDGRGSRLAENKNTRIWLAELKWIGRTDGRMDGRTDGRTLLWGFLDLPLHTTLATSNYEYQGLKFKNALFFVLFTVVLPLLIWKPFYLLNSIIKKTYLTISKITLKTFYFSCVVVFMYGILNSTTGF